MYVQMYTSKISSLPYNEMLETKVNWGLYIQIMRPLAFNETMRVDSWVISCLNRHGTIECNYILQLTMWSLFSLILKGLHKVQNPTNRTKILDCGLWHALWATSICFFMILAATAIFGGPNCRISWRRYSFIWKLSMNSIPLVTGGSKPLSKLNWKNILLGRTWSLRFMLQSKSDQEPSHYYLSFIIYNLTIILLSQLR